MKLCPSCGAELDEKATVCSICDAKFPLSGEPKVEPPTRKATSLELSVKLAEMRSKIEQLSSTKREQESIQETKPVADLPKPVESKKEEPISTSFEASEIEEASEEEATEEEFEEYVIETRHYDRGAINGLEIANLGKPAKKKIEITGRKIKAEDTKEAARKRRMGIGLPQIVAAIIIVAIVIIASWALLLNKPSVPTPAIDGVLDEWRSIVKYSALVESDDLTLNFEETAVQFYEGSVFWYFRTSSDLYKTSDRITSYALLIDSDGDENTGFFFLSSFGADLMVLISGSGGQKISSGLYSFDSDDTLNWSAWKNIRTIPIATLISQAEANFTAPASFSEENAKFVSLAFDGKSKTCITPFFCLEPGVLIITQGSLIPSTGVILNEPGQHVLQLIVKAFGATGEVDSIIPTVSGAPQIDLGPVTWLNEDEMNSGKVVTLSVDCSAIASGTKITAFVEEEDVLTDFKTIMIMGMPAVGYVGNIPSGITIDGCFADWNNFDLDIGDVTPPSNNNIDLTRTAKTATLTDAYFFAEVFGNMLKGNLVPVEESQLGPGGIGGEGTVSDKVTGEDLIQIYIDVDPYSDIGAPSPVADSALEPDFMIEVGGKDELILHETFFEWDVDAWYEDPTVDISSAIDNQRIEIEVSKSSIGDLNGSDIAIISTDWLGSMDDFTESSVAIDPFKINLQGDVWGSLDGISWTPKADVLNATNSLIDLTSDAVGNLYAVFTNGTVYASYDLANSWTRLIAGSLANIIAITTDGVGQLYSITPGGNTYNALLSGGPWAYRGDINWAADIVDLDWSYGTSPNTASIFAVRSTPNTKLAYSANGGASWVQFKKMPPTMSTVASVAVLNNSITDLIYVLERDGDVYVSNDSADNWVTTHISAGGGSDFTASPCIDLDIDSNGNLWVVRGQGEVYRLVTSNWTWETLNPTADASAINSISSVPIPEFSDFLVISFFCIIIPMIFIHRRMRRN